VIPKHFWGDIQPQNFPERVVWYTLLATYGLYLIGGLYLAGSIIGWVLLLCLCRQLWQQTLRTPEAQRLIIPWTIWVWIVGMLVMQIALIMGHLDFDLGLGQILKSSAGWAKGWALLAIYPLVGCLSIRPQLVHRAACWVCLQTLLLFPFFLLAYLIRLPEDVYLSPLRVLGGGGDSFFMVKLYTAGEGAVRWQLFAPWAPALGFISNIYFFFALEEKKRFWRFVGIAGSILMCAVSVSRLAIVALPCVWLATWLICNARRPIIWLGLSAASVVAGLMGSTLLSAIETSIAEFRSLRADSSRARDMIGRIAVDRWWNDAPIWGHGIGETGPFLTAFVPIGSHHTWYGLLFTKGIVGLIALAIPMLVTFIDLVVKAQTRRLSRLGLAMFLLIFMYAFGENLDILVYLVWPGFLVMGMGLSDRQPLAEKAL
jgi:uncharacterized membrane protein